MDADNIKKTPKKTNKQNSSNKDEQTCLSINNKSPILNKKSKCRSEINIRQKKQLSKLNEQLNELKQKVDISKDILTTIYSKVKLKQSRYQKELSTKDLHIYQTNKLVNDYKIMYQNELKRKEECIDRNRTFGKERLDQNLDHEARLKIRNNVLQRIKKKGVVFNKDLLQSILTLKQNQQKMNENQSQKRKTKQNDSTLIKRVKKSHSQFNHKKTKSLIIQNYKQTKIKPCKPAPRQKHTNSIVQKTNSNQDAKKQNFRLAEYKRIQIQPSDDKKTLYDIYKQRITKRQRQQNSQKMSWVVQKLQENLNDLQMIRKKSQLKLSQIKKQALNENQIERKQKYAIKKQQSHKKIHNQALKQLEEIKRQKSKQKYIRLQKSKLKNLDQAS